MTTVTVPGKVMLAGEYAVLGGAPALAATVAARLTVRVVREGYPRAALVRSSLWPNEVLVSRDTRRTPDEEPLFGAVRRGLELYGLEGVTVDVTSDLAVANGVGSSSALRLGVLLAMATAAGEPAETAAWTAARHAWLLQRGAQGRASGYDVATQLLGGLVRFRGMAEGPDGDPLVAQAWPVEATRLNDNLFRNLPRLARVYVGGRGAPTTTQIKGVGAWLGESGRGGELTALSTELVAAFEAALAAPTLDVTSAPTSFRPSAIVRTDSAAEPRRKTTAEGRKDGGPEGSVLGRLVGATAAHRQFFAAAPGFPASSFTALAEVPGFDTTFSAKTTGAGGEDALLLVGAVPDAAAAALAGLGWRPLAYPFERRGALVTEGGFGGGAGTPAREALVEELW